MPKQITSEELDLIVLFIAQSAEGAGIETMLKKGNLKLSKRTLQPEALRLQLHKIGRVPDSNRVAGTFAHDILNRLLIDLSWASSYLEGNTYSRLDTQRLPAWEQNEQ